METVKFCPVLFSVIQWPQVTHESTWKYPLSVLFVHAGAVMTISWKFIKSYTKTIADLLSLLTKASSNVCTSPLFCQLLHVEFKALGLIWKKTPLSQILMSAFTQSDRFSQTVQGVDSFWSPTLSTDLVYSHRLPSPLSLFSSLPCAAAAGGPWSWGRVLPPCLSITERQLVCLLTHTGQACSPPTRWVDLPVSKVCCKFFRNKNALLC